MPSVANGDLARHSAQPLVIGKLHVELVRRRQRLEDEARIEHGDRRAIFWRRCGEISDRRKTRGSRHVLHHDRRIAWNVPTEVARKHPGILVVTAARRVADDEGYRFSSKKLAVLRNCIPHYACTKCRCNRSGGYPQYFRASHDAVFHCNIHEW
jgi:hypothetical protein